MTDTTNTDDGIQVNEMIADGKVTEADRTLILMQLARDARDEARAQRDVCRASLSEMEVEADAIVDALQSAILQIEYLHEKFGETGSGNAELSRARAAMKKAVADGVGSPGAFVGMRSTESRARSINTAMRGDDYIKANGAGVALPIARMTGNDIWAITVARDLPYLRIYDIAQNRERARSEITLAHPAGLHVVANGEPRLWIDAYPDHMQHWFDRWPNLRGLCNV